MEYLYDENITIRFRDIIRDSYECDAVIPKALLDFREYIVWKALTEWERQPVTRHMKFEVRDAKSQGYFISRYTYTNVVGRFPRNYKAGQIQIFIPSLLRTLKAFEPTAWLLQLNKEIHG